MKLIILSFLVVSTTWAQTSYVESTRLLRKGGNEFSLGVDSFTSSHNVDTDGTTTALSGGETFNRIQSEIRGLYGAADNFQIAGGARYRQNTSTFFDLNSQSMIDGTSSGLQSVFLGAQYAIKQTGQWHSTIDGTLRYSTYKNDEFDLGDDPKKLVLGDDGNEYMLGTGLTYAFKSNDYITGRLGYRSPGSRISDEAYWQLEGALVWKYIALVAGVDGATSLGNDPYKDDQINKPLYNTGATGLYNGTNRSWMSPFGGANIALGDNWRVELRGGTVASGKSTDLGTFWSFNIARRSEPTKARKIDTKFKTYDIEATVTKVSPKKGYVMIDKGLSDDIEKGMVLDLFEFDYVGGNILVARGTVIKSKANIAVIKITAHFNSKKEIKAGLIARGAQR